MPSDVGPHRRFAWCYDTAGRYLETHPESELRYAEGFGYCPADEEPIEHAWLLTRDGVVVDLHWTRPEPCAYQGVAFDRDTYLSLVQETGTCKVMDLAVQRWRDSCP